MCAFEQFSPSRGRRARTAPGTVRHGLKPLLLAMSLAGLVGPALAAGPTVADNQLPSMRLVAGSIDTKTSSVVVDGTSYTNSDLAVDKNGILTMTINQTSSKAVWEASNFSVGAKAAFVNNGPSVNSDTLIRVTGGTPSGIYGSVIANNRLWLVNGAGWYVGPSGSINANSVLMSARDVSATEVESGYANFMAGKPLSLTIGANDNDYGSGGYIELAKGALVQAEGGIVMVAPKAIHNAGTIISQKGGTVSMLVGHDAEVQLGDSGFITLAPPSATVADNTGYGRALFNEGTIQADDGHIDLLVAGTGNSGVFFGGTTDAAAANGTSVNGLENTGSLLASSNDGSSSINARVVGSGGLLLQSGVIDASGRANVATSKGGSINLSGAYIIVDGSVVADGQAAGGQITMTGTGDPRQTNVILLGNASLLSAGSKLSGQGGSVTLTGSLLSASGTISVDGVAGGGQIDLLVNSVPGGSINIDSSAVLSADATTAGSGGKIRVLGDTNVQTDTATTNADTASTTMPARTEGGNMVNVYGQLRARGGTEGGDGGTVVVTGQAVNMHTEGEGTQAARFDVSARASTGSHGWVKLYSPEWFVGNYTATNNAMVDYSASALNDTDLSTWLTQGNNVEVGTYARGGQTVGLHVLDGTKISSAYSGGQQLKLTSVTNVDIGSSQAPAGVTIEATGGPLHLTVTADADVDGTGNLQIVGVNVPVATAVPGRATAQASTGYAPVVLRTNGGNIDITGTVSPVGQELSGQAVLIRTANLDAGGGQVNITGGVHASVTPDTNPTRRGVVIENSTIRGTDILIHGRGFNDNGVTLSDVTLNLDRGVLAINGEALVSGEISGDGVNVQDTYVHMDGGHMVLLGSSYVSQYGAGSGLRIGNLDITATGTANWPNLARIIMVGSSRGSYSPGLQVVGGIYLHGADGKTDADLALGASADATKASSALELGESYFETTGRIGVRPTEYIDGPIFNQVDTPIYLGYRPDVANFNTNFIVSPNLFNGNMGTGLNIVVGSNLHKGAITVADQVFNGQTVVTLQNQGTGSGGIELGAQGGLILNKAAPGRARALAADTTTAGTLNLVTTGNVSQTGPITADAVNVVAGPSSVVNLSNPNNHITSLLVNGGSSVQVPQDATPASTSTVYAYDGTNNSFVTISATNGRPTTNDTPVVVLPDPLPPSRTTVESTDVLNETRTDVYVRGQFTRPQVCTPAGSGGAGFELTFDPLAQQWLQVRRSAQLSTCSSVRSDSNCSAF